TVAPRPFPARRRRRGRRAPRGSRCNEAAPGRAMRRPIPNGPTTTDDTWFHLHGAAMTGETKRLLFACRRFNPNGNTSCQGLSPVLDDEPHRRASTAADEKKQSPPEPPGGSFLGRALRR